jgi:hypothetical protein
MEENFVLTSFLSFVKEGIQQQFITLYTPYQNRVVERRNCTIVEMGRGMLGHKAMPNRYWVEAIHTILYMLSRFPTKAMQNINVEVAWSRRKSLVSCFEVFGSATYVLILEEKITKLEKLMFTWNSEQHKAYMMIDISTC